MSKSTIFRLQPFEPKRVLVLPCEGGEITLYVLDGKIYPRVAQPGPPRYGVHFGGWVPSFQNSEFTTPWDHLVREGYYSYYALEVIFRLVPREAGGQTAEIVAVSYDGCQTFYENELCTLPREYAQQGEVHTG